MTGTSIPGTGRTVTDYLGNHYRHDLKLNGYVLLPLDFTIAFNAGWRSAFRWTPQIWYYDNPRNA